MRLPGFPVVLVALLAAASSPAHAQDVAYRVVVHASNPIARLTRDQVSRIFLRKVTLWDNRLPVLPVDQTTDSPVRRTFTKEIHHRTIASVQTWWQQQTFAGAGVAPPERPSDLDILDYIRKYPNAIGYVKAGIATGADIRVVTVIP